VVDGFPPNLRGGQTQELKELYEKAGINNMDRHSGVLVILEFIIKLSTVTCIICR
jgi:hypothetical protein